MTIITPGFKGGSANSVMTTERRIKTLENQVNFLKGQIDGIRQLVVENNASLAMLIAAVNEEAGKTEKRLDG